MLSEDGADIAVLKMFNSLILTSLHSNQTP